MNAKELYEVLIAHWSPARIETLEILIKHGSLTIKEIGALRNVKTIYLTDGFALMHKNGLIGFNPPPPTLKRSGDIHLSTYLRRKNVLQNTKIFSKISIDEFSAFKKYSDEVKKQKTEERRLKSIRYNLKKQFSGVIIKLNEEQLRQASKYIQFLDAYAQEEK